MNQNDDRNTDGPQNQDGPWFGRRWYDSLNQACRSNPVPATIGAVVVAKPVAAAAGRVIDAARGIGSSVFAREAGRVVVQETASETAKGIVRGSRGVRYRGF